MALLREGSRQSDPPEIAEDWNRLREALARLLLAQRGDMTSHA